MAINAGTASAFLELDTSRFTRSLHLAGQDLRNFADSSQSISNRISNLGSSMTTIGTNLSKYVTVPLVAAGIGVSKFSIDFNASMANIATLIPKNAKRVDELKSGIQDLAVDTGKATSDIADGTYQVISAFGDTNDTLKITEINAKAATAGMATTTDAINLTSAVTKGYGDTSAEAVKKAADLAFQVVKLGQTSFPELAGSLGKVVPLSKQLGIEQEEMYNIFATSTGVTGTASEVSTQYRGVLQSLMAPTTSMNKLFNKLGVENGEAMIKQYGLMGSMEKIVEAANESGEPLQKYIGSIEGQTIALALTGEQSDIYKEKLKQMQDASGAMTEAFDEQSQGVNAAGFEWQQAKRSMVVAAQRMGDALAPAIKTISQLIIKATDKIKGMNDEQIKTIVKIGGIIAAIGPAIFFLGKLISIISGVIGAIGAISGAIGLLTGTLTVATPAATALAGAITVLTGPVGLVIAAIAAVVAGVILCYKNFDKLKAKFESFSTVGKIFATVAVLMNPIATIIAGITLAIKGVQYATSDAIPEVQLFGEETSEATKEAVGAYMELDEQAGQALMNLKLTSSVVTEETKNTIVNNFNQMGQQIKEGIDKHFQETYDTMEDFFAKSSALTEEEEAEALDKMKENNDNKKAETDKYVAKINKIMSKASKEKRNLTKEEQQEIKKLQDKMRENAIVSLSENEVEAKAIMERMKQQADEMTALQAAEVVKNITEQTNKAVDQANTQYDETIKAIIKQRDEAGTISAEQADKLIADAKKQRDETIDNAEEMREKVIKEAKIQAGEHVDKVDWTTGEIKSNWRILKEDINKKLSEIGDSISKKWTEIKTNTSRKWNEIKESVSMKAKEIYESVRKKVTDIKNNIIESWTNLKSKTSSIWNGLKNSVTSKMSDIYNSVKSKIDAIKNRFKFKLKLPKIEIPKIKLPHFSIEGKFSLAPPKVPKLKVKFFADGGILTRPTLFGGMGSTMFVGGEAGHEAILPISKLSGILADTLRNLKPNFGNRTSNSSTKNNVVINVSTNSGDKVIRELRYALGGDF